MLGATSTLLGGCWLCELLEECIARYFLIADAASRAQAVLVGRRMSRSSPLVSGSCGWIYSIDVFVVAAFSLPLRVIGFALEDDILPRLEVGDLLLLELHCQLQLFYCLNRVRSTKLF